MFFELRFEILRGRENGSEQKETYRIGIQWCRIVKSSKTLFRLSFGWSNWDHFDALHGTTEWNELFWHCFSVFPAHYSLMDGLVNCTLPSRTATFFSPPASFQTSRYTQNRAGKHLLFKVIINVRQATSKPKGALLEHNGPNKMTLIRPRRPS